jgi:hypothetical protein
MVSTDFRPQHGRHCKARSPEYVCQLPIGPRRTKYHGTISYKLACRALGLEQVPIAANRPGDLHLLREL